MNALAKKFFFIGNILLALVMIHCSPSRINNSTVKSNMSSDTLLANLLGRYPPYFDSIIKNKDAWNVQIIYTQVDNDQKGNPVFTDHYYNVDPDHYFYPASTVKFPVAALALQRLHELKKKGLTSSTTMLTETDGDGQTSVTTDSSDEDGRPTIAHYIKKILLVSDNDAFNRLYEFLGQEYINERLHKMGYTDVQIVNRLAITLSEAQNRHTNPVRFVDEKGKTIYEKPAQHSEWVYQQRTTQLGKGYIRGEELINEPFDFSKKNKLSLPDLHSMIRSVIMPAAVDKQKRFDLTPEDYDFLRKYMSMYPREAGFPPYDAKEYPDNYVKKYIYGNDSAAVINPDIRIYNKTGTSYGFLIDASYITDTRKNIRFFLSAVIYCNSDGILNDDKYDYDTIGYPFFKHLGQVVYEYEINRKKAK